MAVAVHPVTAAERARRTRVYEEALASVRLEGFELDEQVKELYRRYIGGELTLAEVGSAIDELDDQESDPYLYPGTSVLKTCADSLTRIYWSASKRAELIDDSQS